MVWAAGVRAGPSAKKASASATGMVRTSWILRPPKVYSRTEAWKPLPSHSSQTVVTVSMKPSSVKMSPAPLHTGQAPSEFALKSAGLTPFALAKALRIGSSRPV